MPNRPQTHPQMYKAHTMILDSMDRYRTRPRNVKDSEYRDMFSQMLAKMNSDDVSPEDFLFRVTDHRDIHPHHGRVTLLELNAVPVSEARILLGVRN